MGGGGKGGSADPSGMYMAMASAQAAQEAYQLGEQQLKWTQDVYNQQWPLISESEQTQIALAQEEQAAMIQQQVESQQQWQQYEQLYAPLETKFAGEAQNWASPSNMALVSGQAAAGVGEAGMNQLNAAADTLRSYGINPSSPRYASLFTSAQPLLGAAQAAAGTTARQNLALQGLGLESSAINTGRGLVNAAQGLTQAGTGAGSAAAGAASGAGSTASTNLSTGSQAMTNPSQWFNAGANNMNSYVNAVNGYNDAQARFAEANASEMGGFGSAAGSILGMGIMKIAKGGAVQRFQDGGDVLGSDPQLTPTQGGGPTGYPGPAIPPAAMPADPRMAQMQGNALPADATPGGAVPASASPSYGRNIDDVHSVLTAGEFVWPVDAVRWMGEKNLVAQLDKARAEKQAFDNRDDVGGEPAGAIPQQPTFMSRPQAGRPLPVQGAMPPAPQQSPQQSPQMGMT
jgi:hypothetical protein